MAVKVASVAAIHKGKLLLGRRRDTRKWNCPGGHMEARETPLVAAKRELYEETGLKGTKWRHLGHVKTKGGVVVYSFVCRVNGSLTAKNDPDREIVEFKWVSPKELPSEVMSQLHNKEDVTLQLMGAQEPTLDIKKSELTKGEWKPAFLNHKTGQLVVTPIFHDTDALPDGEFTPDWEDGFVGPDNQFHSRDETQKLTQKRDSYEMPGRNYADLVGELMGPSHWASSPFDKTAPSWRSKDGIRIPKVGTPEREAWDEKFKDALVHRFGYGDPNRLRQVEIPVESAQGRNLAVNKDRLNLYTRMARGGDVLPPVVVKQNGKGWMLFDGNHRQEAARRAGLEKLHGYEILPAPNGDARKNESWDAQVGEWLGKATNPDDFRGILRGVDPKGREYVDEQADYKGHPEALNPVVEEYKTHVLDSPKTVRREPGRKHGISKKLIYPVKGYQGKDFNGNQPILPGLGIPEPFNRRYMVKPYHEKINAAGGDFSSWMHFPVQGWAEMTNQALYHAGGIGHLHQKVHVAPHRIPPVTSRELLKYEPGVVVQMDPDVTPLENHGKTFTRFTRKLVFTSPFSQEAHMQANQIGLMDFLSNNLDRHRFNLMADPTHTHLLAIDHGRNFQYLNGHIGKWQRHPRSRETWMDSPQSYMLSNGSPIGMINAETSQGEDDLRVRFARHHENMRPVIKWWDENSDAIKAAMNKRLQLIKNKFARKYIADNFAKRAAFLDNIAHHYDDNDDFKEGGWLQSKVSQNLPKFYENHPQELDIAPEEEYHEATGGV